MILPGPLRFLRYAFMPNHLGYCGGSDSLALLDCGHSGQVDQGLIDLERQFGGAFPYLQLIARANGVADPLDSRVVEAYWIGNGLLDGVDVGALSRSVQDRFQARTRSGDWPWLASKALNGARPHHSFHVLEVYPRVGLMASGLVDRLIETMGDCLVRWGRVSAVLGPALQVEAPALRLHEGALELTPPRAETITRWLDGRGFVDDVKPGDTVAIHWRWACDVLTATEQQRLERVTRWHLHLCNQTI